jgi:hypothetical protein
VKKTRQNKKLKPATDALPGNRFARRTKLFREAREVAAKQSPDNKDPRSNNGGSIMWAFIINLIYDQSCRKYLADVTRHQHRWI